MANAHARYEAVVLTRGAIRVDRYLRRALFSRGRVIVRTRSLHRRTVLRSAG